MFEDETRSRFSVAAGRSFATLRMTVSERDVGDTDSRSTFEQDVSMIALDLKVFKFLKSLYGCQGLDESGDLGAKASNRPLDLAHQLQEGCHHTVGNGPGLDAEYSPKEGRCVTTHETNVHESPGYGIVVKPGDCVLLDKVLKV